MKKIILIILLITCFFNGYTQVIKIGETTINKGGKGDKGDMPSFTINGTPVVDGSAIIVEGGENNPNVFYPTLVTDFTSPNVDNANKVWELRSNVDLAGGNFTAPANITIKCNGGSLLNIGNFVGNETKFIHEVSDGSLGIIDLFDANLSGNFKVGIIYAQNFGAIDDNLESTDNYNVGKQMLYLVNQSSGHLIWNKKLTGKFWASVGFPYAYTSPFFNTANNNLWLVGNGFDDVTVEHAGTEIITITNNFIGSKRYVFYDTERSIIKGGVLRGDRYRHFYDQAIHIRAAATSNGSVNINIKEPDYRFGSNILKEIDVDIPVTLSDITTNVQEITDFINTDPRFSDYTATNNGLVTTDVHGATIGSGGAYEISLRTVGGMDFILTVDDVSTGMNIVEKWSPYEWGHGIIYGSGSYYCIVKDIHITEFHGDGIDTQLQGNGTEGITLAALTNGNIAFDGVIDNANTNFYYQTNTRQLPNQVTPRPLWVSLASNSQAVNILKNNTYRLAYYDADDNFLEVSPPLITFEKYYPRVEAKRYRIIVENIGANMSSFNYFLNSRSDAIGGLMENFEVSFCRRQGISNPPMDFTMRDFKIHDIGGQEPQFGIDLEDNHKHNRGWLIDKGEFWNNTNGDIIIKGASQGTISNCYFRQNAYNTRLSQDSKATAITTTYARNVTIHSNFFQFKTINLDIEMQFHNNDLYESIVVSNFGGSVIKDNYMVNTLIASGQSVGSSESESNGGSDVGYSINNIRYFNNGWGNRTFDDNSNGLVNIGNTLIFHHKPSNQFALQDESLRDILVQDTQENYIRSQRTLPDLPQFKGYTVGETVKGLKAAPNARNLVAYTKYYSNIQDLNVEFPLKIEAGFPFSAEMKNIKAWGLWLRLNQFGTDGVGDFETLKVVGGEFKMPPRISANEGFLNNTLFGSPSTNKFIRVHTDRNINLVFNGTDFISEDASTGLFMFLGHRGTTVFKECTFEHPTGDTVNLTSVGTETTIGTATGANTGAITFIDCDFNNISFTLRAGDKILYTKPHPNAPTYADNATALAAMGEGYYYKVTATNEFAITHL